MNESSQKLDMEERAWVWEIHKNCDSLIHQRLAAFTAAQSMALASFTLLTVARFNADPCKISEWRIFLLDVSRVWIVLFGLILSYFAYMVIAPMLIRLDYLNEKYFFPYDPVYKGYIECIEDSKTVSDFEGRVGNPSLAKFLSWVRSGSNPAAGQSFYRSYRSIIAVRLPTCEFIFWAVLGVLLVAGIISTSVEGAPKCPGEGKVVTTL